MARQGWPLAAGEEPQLAAHLVTPRSVYTHHGLYIGHGQVIHYAGLSHGPYGGPVEVVSLERFARGRGIWVLSGGVRFELDQVVSRARSRLGENRYRIFTNNCEHFCEWCLRGESRSLQVELLRARWRALLARVTGAISRSFGGISGTGIPADRRCSP